MLRKNSVLSYAEMRLAEFDYDLPDKAIAQQPLQDRAGARMLLLERSSGRIEDSLFRALPSLVKGNELVVVNNARVIPARLYAHRAGTHAELPGKHSPAQKEFLTSCLEVLLTRRIDSEVWEALVRPGRKVGSGERLFFEESDLEAEVLGGGPYGVRQLRFHAGSSTRSLKSLAESAMCRCHLISGDQIELRTGSVIRPYLQNSRWPWRLPLPACISLLKSSTNYAGKASKSPR